MPNANGTGGVDGFLYRTMNGRVIKSVIPPGKGVQVNYKVSGNVYCVKSNANYHLYHEKGAFCMYMFLWLHNHQGEFFYSST